MKSHSKIFWGIPLGMYEYVYPKLTQLWEDNYNDIFMYVQAINHKLPDGVYINISYERYNGPLNEIEFHLDFFDDYKEYYALNEIGYSSTTTERDLYGTFGDLLKPDSKPVLYTRSMIY